jgi:hypothetical protein
MPEKRLVHAVDKERGVEWAQSVAARKRTVSPVTWHVSFRESAGHGRDIMSVVEAVQVLPRDAATDGCARGRGVRRLFVNGRDRRRTERELDRDARRATSDDLNVAHPHRLIAELLGEHVVPPRRKYRDRDDATARRGESPNRCATAFKADRSFLHGRAVVVHDGDGQPAHGEALCR